MSKIIKNNTEGRKEMISCSDVKKLQQILELVYILGND